MSSTSYSKISNSFPGKTEDVLSLWNYLAGQSIGVPVRVESAARFSGVSPALLQRILESMASENIVKLTSVEVCAEHSGGPQPLEQCDDETYVCTLCDRIFKKGEFQMKDFIEVNQPLATMGTESDVGRDTKKPMFDRRQKTWDNEVVYDDFRTTFTKLQGPECDWIMRKVEEYGIAWVTIQGHDPRADILEFLEHHIGPACESQNDYDGKVKTATPKPDGIAGSADTSNDLGLHVDGTQEPETPALLALQYVNQGDLGASSVFIDVARALEEFPDKEDLLVALAASDAATFDKKNMKFTGPVFRYIADYRTVAIRFRLDAVMTLGGPYLALGNRFKEHLDAEKYKIRFTPQKGDLVVFDNWRLMHARTEVRGQAQREHRRMWVRALKATVRNQRQIGIRITDNALLADIERANRRR